MIKSLIACLLSLLAFGSAPVLAAPPDVEFTAGSEIARIGCGYVTGTAFHIGDGRYVTANHVVEACQGSSTVTFSDKGKDYALLSGPMIDRKLEIDCSDFKEGDFYQAIGYGMSFYEPMYQPWIAAPFSRDGYQSFVGESIPGMSGGPVLDKKNKVRGIADMRWPARALPLKATVLCKE